MRYIVKENQLDYETYYTLRESVGWNNWSKEQAENALKNSYYSIVIYDKDNAIGMGRVVGDGIYFIVADIVVKPEYQGNKIGTKIIKYILEYIEKNMSNGKGVLMIKYIIKRLLQLIPILIGITFLSFAMMRLAGGDAVTYMYDNAGSAVSQEVIDQTKKEYGLDQPFLVQYAKWFAGMVTGDMGTSYVSKRDVYDTFVEKLPATILLTLSSVLLTMLVAIPLGIISAVKHNKWSDYLIRFLSFIGNSMPNFFAALVLMYFFSIKLGWLPVITTDNVALSLVLPTLTLAVSMASKYTRQVRATVLEELNKDYVIGARARGVRGSVIIWKNVMKSSMLTIITLLALSIGNLLGGTTIVETIFMWDGVGKMAVDAITMRDYPIIQAYVAWMAIIYVVVNLITDIIYHYLDPRVRLGGDRA